MAKHLTYKNVIENLNILDYEYYFRVTDAILQADISELLLIFNEIIENGFDGQHFITELSGHFRNLLVIKDPATIELLLASPSLKDRYAEQATNCQAGILLKLLDICNKYDLSYKTSNNKRLHIEIALMQLSQQNIQLEEPISARSKPITKTSFQEKPVAYKTEKEKVEVKSKVEIPADQTQEEETEKKSLDEPKTTPKPKSTVKPVKQDSGRKIKNISIKDSLDALKRKAEAAEEEEVPVIINEFDQDRLTKIWNIFTESYKSKSPSFSNAIAKYKPVLKKNFEIEYQVDNIIIARDILNVTSLLEFLKKELNNNQITLKPVLPDKKETKVAYTDREKFEEMSKKYPDLIKLKEQLNLELDF